MITQGRIRELAKDFVDQLYEEGYDVEGVPFDKNPLTDEYARRASFSERIASFTYCVVIGQLK